MYITTGISVVSVALMALAGAKAGMQGPHQAQWLALSIVMSVVGAAVPGYEQIRKERDVIEAAVGMRVAMNDALDPIVRQLGRIANATDSEERRDLRERTVPMVLDSAAHLIDAERVRASWFRLVKDRPRRLVPEQYAGRADQPDTVFVEGTIDGDSVFAMIRHNQHVVSVDVESEPPPGWRGSARHGYRSFIAVPVVAGPTAYGMLTVDAIDAGGVTEREVPLVRLLAGLLADALACGSEKEARRWPVR